MKIPFSIPDITNLEINEVIETLNSGWITTGLKTKKFEQKIAEYCHTKKAVCLNSATACLELTLRILGVGKGDEVITTAYTYTATASVVCHVGAKLVLIDTDKNSYEMNYEELEKKINSHTKVIIPVDLAGVMCRYDKIFEIIENKKHLFHGKNNIQQCFGRVIVLSDSAHSFGAVMQDKFGAAKKCGETADFTCFSFHAVKNLTTAEGGAVTWREKEPLDSEKIYEQYMLMSLHGQTKDAFQKTKVGAWEYDIISPFYKCNMTDIAAAIGLAQLSRYDILLEKRKNIVLIYDEEIKKWNKEEHIKIENLKHFSQKNNSSCHLYLIRLVGKNEIYRNKIMESLAKKGIAVNVHYKPLPMLTAYKAIGYNIKDYPNAYEQYKNEITLPLHSKMEEKDALYVINNLMELLKKDELEKLA